MLYQISLNSSTRRTKLRIPVNEEGQQLKTLQYSASTVADYISAIIFMVGADSVQLYHRQGSSQMESGRRAGQGSLLQKPHLEDLPGRLLQRFRWSSYYVGDIDSDRRPQREFL